MKKALIHFFSGTGNTRHCVELIEDTLSKMGYEVNLINIEDSTKNDTKSDLHIFAYPMYGFGAPTNMLNYIKKLKGLEGSSAAIISVGGSTGKSEGDEGQSLYHVSSILNKKGMKVFFTELVSYPENFTQIVNPPDEETIRNIFSDTDKKVHKIGQKIGYGIENIKKRSWIAIALSWIVFELFSKAGRRMLGKFYIADSSCNGCSVCASKCPVNCISMNNKRPNWNWSCQCCQRCINICPQKAIQVSVLRLVLMILAMIIPIFVLTQVSSIITISGILKVIVNIILYIVLSIILTVLFDGACYLLEKTPMRKVFEFNYTKKYRRYMAKSNNNLQ